MLKFGSVLVFFLLYKSILSICESEEKKFSVEYQWNYINFTWESPDALQNAVQTELYIPENYLMAGIKIYKDTIYLVLPRGSKKTRITLTSVPRDSPKENPLLTPFPSWEANTEEKCDALLNVMSMEIDKNGIMWILDTKRDVLVTQCPPKIVLIDLNRNNKVIQSYIIPNELCPWDKGCFVNDIVLDGDYCYMSDTTATDPGILVYNRKLNDAWKFRDPTMFGDRKAANFTSQGYPLTTVQNVNGIALSPDCGQNRTLYFSCLTGYNLYSVSNFILKNKQLSGGKISKYITDLGQKLTQSAGMAMDESGYMYHGLQPLDAVAVWDTSRPLCEDRIISQDHEKLGWPDSAVIDNEGRFYYITNNLLKFTGQKEFNKTDVNFRVVMWHVNKRSYFYCDSEK